MDVYLQTVNTFQWGRNGDSIRSGSIVIALQTTILSQMTDNLLNVFLLKDDRQNASLSRNFHQVRGMYIELEEDLKNVSVFFGSRQLKQS